MTEWLGENFDPEAFDPEKINKYLEKLNIATRDLGPSLQKCLWSGTLSGDSNIISVITLGMSKNPAIIMSGLDANWTNILPEELMLETLKTIRSETSQRYWFRSAKRLLLLKQENGNLPP